jgi:hypothetical protein
LLHPAADHGVRSVSSLSLTTEAANIARPSSRTPTLQSFSLHSGRIPSPRHCCLVHRNPCPSRCFCRVRPESLSHKATSGV